MFMLMEGIPYFCSDDCETRLSKFRDCGVKYCGHTKVFSLHEAFPNRPVNTLSCLLFVTIVSSAIKQTVPRFDGIVNGLKQSLKTCALILRLNVRWQ